MPNPAFRQMQQKFKKQDARRRFSYQAFLTFGFSLVIVSLSLCMLVLALGLLTPKTGMPLLAFASIGAGLLVFAHAQHPGA